MTNLIVFTNNSIVAEFCEQKKLPVEVKWVTAPAMEVLAAAKSAARLGAVVISNPMAGVRTTTPLFGSSGFEKQSTPGIKSINPYLSVLASEGHGTVDFISVKTIDEALSLYKKNARLRFAAHNDDMIKAFQAADLEMLLNTFAAMQNSE